MDGPIPSRPRRNDARVPSLSPANLSSLVSYHATQVRAFLKHSTAGATMPAPGKPFVRVVGVVDYCNREISWKEITFGDIEIASGRFVRVPK
jgi:hypothetical protein